MFGDNEYDTLIAKAREAGADFGQLIREQFDRERQEAVTVAIKTTRAGEYRAQLHAIIHRATKRGFTRDEIRDLFIEALNTNSDLD